MILSSFLYIKNSIDINCIQIKQTSIHHTMFCCTRPNHQGMIVTDICQEEQCIKADKQQCCSQCIRQHHSSHSVVPMKKLLPQLLNSNNEKKYYFKLLENMVVFMEEQFRNDQFYKTLIGSTKIDVSNVGQVVKTMLLEFRKVNKQENKKLKQIQKTLKISNEVNKASFSPPKSSISNNNSSPRKFESMKSHGHYENVPLSYSIIASIQTFSHSLKHPYITVSPDMRSVFKSSQAAGYKLAALSSCSIPPEADNAFFNIKIIKSTGNILLGLGIPEIIKEKQYLNCYGAGHGTYLMGQNGNDPKSSILFHHSDNVYNRKEIVGWNYKQGQILGVGIKKQDSIDLICFRKYHINSNGKPDFKKVQKQFTMPLWPKQNLGHRLHVVAILQSINDQVEFIPTEQ